MCVCVCERERERERQTRTSSQGRRRRRRRKGENMADAFLIIVCIILPVIILLGNVYVLINFQHPEDHNQAYFPKAVVVFSLTLSVMSVLMFPLDVANTRACDEDISCSLTLPMKDLWYAVYVIMAINVAFIIPFCIFFYEVRDIYI